MSNDSVTVHVALGRCPSSCDAHRRRVAAAKHLRRSAGDIARPPGSIAPTAVPLASTPVSNELRRAERRGARGDE
jgi:hypothetical protein